MQTAGTTHCSVTPVTQSIHLEQVNSPDGRKLIVALAMLKLLLWLCGLVHKIEPVQLRECLLRELWCWK
jgi:hypothetical protein